MATIEDRQSVIPDLFADFGKLRLLDSVLDMSTVRRRCRHLRHMNGVVVLKALLLAAAIFVVCDCDAAVATHPQRQARLGG